MHLEINARDVRLQRLEDGRLRLTVGADRVHDRVQVVRALALTDPDHYVAFLDEQGQEICMIRDPAELDAAARQLLQEELERKYLTSRIQRIYSLRSEMGVAYFDVETQRGRREFVVPNVHDSARWLSERRVLFIDVDGNRFEIPDLDTLDKQSVKLVKATL
jgi:hypothetical protein